jgi:probable HAF family extracellular repeat protein
VPRLEALEDRCTPSYTVTDLIPLSGDNVSAAYGINATDQVVGRSVTYDTSGHFLSLHAVLWASNGNPTRLDPLPGYSGSQAWGINAKGQVIGESDSFDTSGHLVATYATLWTNGAPIALTPLHGDHNSSASGINATGQVVGESDDGMMVHAVLWASNGNPTRLDPLPGDSDSSAAGINARGQVVGFAYGPTGFHAVLWTNGAPAPLAQLSGDSESLTGGINARGQVIGISGTDSGSHGVLWDKGVPTIIAPPPGDTFVNPTGINAKGQVVGQSGWTGSVFGAYYPHTAFLWDKGATTDLNTLLVPGSDIKHLWWAGAINDAGQITCEGEMTGGAFHAFLLTPVTAPAIRRGAAPAPPAAGLADAPAVLQPTNFGTTTQLVTAAPFLSAPPAVVPGAGLDSTGAVTVTTAMASPASVYALGAPRPAQDLLFAAWADDAAAPAWPDRLDLLGPGA